MKVVNTSKSIYNTVLMIVTINTNKYSLYTKISPKIKLNHHRNQNSKYSIFKLLLDQRIRYTSHFFIFSKQLFSPSFLPPSSPCALFIIRNFNITDRRRRTAKSKRIWICINYRSPSTTGRLPQHTTTHQYRSFFLRQAQPTRQAS